MVTHSFSVPHISANAWCTLGYCRLSHKYWWLYTSSMPVLVNSFIFISARGGAYQVSGSLGSFSSNSHKKLARRFTCSFGTAFLITAYPLWIQNCQSSSFNIRSGSPLLRSFNLTLLLFAVEGFPGMSLCALAMVGAIVGVIVAVSI